MYVSSLITAEPLPGTSGASTSKDLLEGGQFTWQPATSPPPHPVSPPPIAPIVARRRTAPGGDTNLPQQDVTLRKRVEYSDSDLDAIREFIVMFQKHGASWDIYKDSFWQCEAGKLHPPLENVLERHNANSVKQKFSKLRKT